MPEADVFDVITDQEMNDLVSAVGLAPSPGNNQPWKWYYDGKRLYLFHDRRRSVSFGDFQHMASYLTFGAAIENLYLKAKELGIRINERRFPLDDTPWLIAAFSFTYSAVEKDELSHYIGLRCTNRRQGNARKLSEDLIVGFQEAISGFNRSEE